MFWKDLGVPWERLSVDSGGGDFKCFLKPTLEYLNLLFGGCFDGLLGIFDVNPNQVRIIVVVNHQT